MIDKQQIINQFQQYMEQPSRPPLSTDGRIDLFSFYSELIALKNEIKIESRLVRQGVDTFQDTAALVRQNNQKIDFLIEKETARKQDSHGDKPQPLLQGIIAIYDRVQASLGSIKRSGEKEKTSLLKLIFTGRNNNNNNNDQTIAAIYEGQKMLLIRILELLKGCEVHRIDTIGRRFNPESMRAVATDSISGLEDGMVTAEIRSGFIHENTVFRLADVRVNRIR